MTRRGASIPALVLVALAATAAGDAPAAEEDRSRPAAGGRLAWVFDDDLDLLGDLWVELPWQVSDRDGLVFEADTQTVISKAASDFKFLVRELDYDLRLGWKRGLARGGRFVLASGQLGEERVDAPGQGYVRYVAAGFESARWGRAGDRGYGVAWRAEAGPVFRDREVRADAVARGEVRGRWSAGALDWGADLRVDGLYDRDGSGFDADLEAGPRLGVTLSGGRRADLYLHYLRSRHPLGIDLTTVLVGLDLSESGFGEREPVEPPDVGGAVVAGAGEGRRAGRLLLAFRTPSVRDWEGHLEFDANVLTAEDTGELFYLYHVGIRRPLAEGRLFVGGWYRHRSNHTLAEPNDTVTSTDVVEGGIETDRWERPLAPSEIGPRGRLDGRFRAGYLVDSDFGEDRRLQAHLGVRYLLPWHPRGWTPFLRLDLEDGDVGRRGCGLGLLHRGGLEIRAEYRRDDQYFGTDRTAVLGQAGYVF